MTQTTIPLAKMIDHSLLHPMVTDEQLRQGCELAKKYEVASVCIKPYAVKAAKKILEGSSVEVGAVVGFPHGNSTTQIKVAETKLACEDGATEVDVVVNVGKVLSNEWDYVRNEIQAVVDTAHSHNAIVKVIFENDFLPEDSYKIELCNICTAVGVDFVKTSTGYGFVKGADGKYSYQGATDGDLALMRKHCPDTVQVKAAGGVRTLGDAQRVRALGVTRIGATATEAILEEAKKQNIT